jgi:hypothetical protein
MSVTAGAIAPVLTMGTSAYAQQPPAGPRFGRRQQIRSRKIVRLSLTANWLLALNPGRGDPRRATEPWRVSRDGPRLSP